MRLTEYEILNIKEIVNNFDCKAKIYLFGSRIDDTKKGGDIDLLVISDNLTFKEKRLIKLQLYNKLGEQKIDLIITKEPENYFQKIALAEGILL
ncbi:MAG: nucleotidyltransferase domain-containing protein [Candidatus Margulisiibacteriota bacterium]|jgi:predicted nucleotidyltransferase